MSPVPRILVVDDDENISGLIKIMLERKGFSVVGQVGSGEEAIIKSAELRPDLALMDITLCGFLDGVAAARYIFNLFHIPIIFLTAMYDENLLERAKSAQPYGFIMKPFTDTDLVSGIQAGLIHHNAGKIFPGTFPVGDPETIMNSPDPLIVTDILGKVIFFNPSALVFLDLTTKQLLMNSFKNAARIINDQTGEPSGDLVHEVVTQKRVVSHELNTELVTRSGNHCKISVTARPVMDYRNDLMGVSLSIRKKSA